MKTRVDTIIYNAEQIVTCHSEANQPKRREAMRDVGIIRHGAVAVEHDTIVAVGDSDTIRNTYEAVDNIDATGKIITPGFVDCHTHIIHGGERIAEFEQRIAGATYVEIMQTGGGIVSTMRETRKASLDDLVASAHKRLDSMLRMGTTTVESKSGYGLNPEAELKMLEAMAQLDRIQMVDLVPTFLGAHTSPPEMNVDAYVEQIIEDMIPRVMAWYEQSTFKANRIPLFVDVFCEKGAFNVAQARDVLRHGQVAGMQIKAHVDQFNSLGGTTMAVELGAISVDHLEVTGEDEINMIAGSDTVAVVLPAVNFNLGNTDFANARAMLDAGAIVAIATDYNPGSAPCLSLPLAMSIATRYQRMMPAEALNAVTINAAYAVGLQDRIGSISEGKQADLLIIDTDDYRAISYLMGTDLVQTVMKRGEFVL